MEEKFSIKKLKEMIKEYLIAQEDRIKLIIDGWKYEENEYEIQEIEERISEYEDELIYVERNNEILNKVEEKLRDLKKQVGGEISTTKYIDGFYPEAINDIVDEILTNELIEQDKLELKIKDAKVYTKTKEELEEDLDPECSTYNADMCYSGETTDKVTVMEGIDNKGKRQVVYYYSYPNGDEIISQRRSHNEKQDIELVERKFLRDTGGERLPLDGESIVYQYDKNGRKKIALGDNDIVGAEYFEYDENGEIKLMINEESIHQYLSDGEKKYYIVDGYFKPTNNGYTLLPSKSKYDIEKEEIHRIVGGDLSQEEKEKILSELTPKRQEEVLRILRSMEPIFEYYQEFDSTNTEKREKIISWFNGFSKDLKIDGRTNKHTPQEISNGINVREGQIREVKEETVKEVEERKDKNAQTLGEE